MIEFTDKNGDRWVVRDCDDDDDCVVVEKWIKRTFPPLGQDIAELMRAVDLDPDDHHKPDHADYDLHVPLMAIGDLAEALRRHDRAAGAPGGSPC